MKLVAIVVLKKDLEKEKKEEIATYFENLEKDMKFYVNKN